MYVLLSSFGTATAGQKRETNSTLKKAKYNNNIGSEPGALDSPGNSDEYYSSFYYFFFPTGWVFIWYVDIAFHSNRSIKDYPMAFWFPRYNTIC